MFPPEGALSACQLRVCVCLLPLTQLVPVGQQDGGAVQDVGQRRLDQLPAGDALDGLGQGRGETVQLVLHQHPLEGLGVGESNREGR